MTTELFNICSIYVFIIGLCIGSFLNVVALRAFSGESIVFPPSKCPKCGKLIKPYDNIPVLSYIFLGGECRNCKNPISMQYPLVELITGVGFLSIYYHFENLLTGSEFVLKNVMLLPFFLILLALSIVISITDIKEKVVFDVHTISLTVIILLFQFWGGNILSALIGLVVGAVSMELLSGIGWVLIKKRAFGTGDTYIAASIGALLGAKMFFIALAFAVIIQVICIIPSFITKLYREGEYKVLVTGGIFLTLLFIYEFPFLNIENTIIQYSIIALLTISGIYLCRLILTIKALKENPTYWPFGPSLLISMFLTAFYGGIISHFILTMF